MEAAAVAAAAMVQWLAPMSSPWRLHQRDMMRKIENLHRQVLRKAGGAAAIARAALAGGQGGFPFLPQGRFGSARNFRQGAHQFLEPAGDAPPRLIIREVDEDGQPTDEIINLSDITAGEKTESVPVESGENKETEEEDKISVTLEEEPEEHIAGASGDHPHVIPPLKPLSRTESELDKPPSRGRVLDSNNTNSVAACPRGDDALPHLRGSFHQSGGIGKFSRAFDERPQRGSFRGGMFSGGRNRNFSQGHRNFDRPNSRSFNQSIRHITSPTKFDLNCGFTDDEVEELLCQGIKPWDSEAAAALAVLHGEMDHLLN